MTREQWSKLSDGDKLVKIAKLCGWYDSGKIYSDLTSNPDEIIWYHPDLPDECRITRNLPDYLNDLNAMHRAEELLSYEQNIAYNQLLKGEYEASWPFHATAAERAEAFVLTMGASDG